MENVLTQYLNSIDNPLSRELSSNLEHIRHYARPVLAAIATWAADREDRVHEPLAHAEEVGNLCASLLPGHLLGRNANQLGPVEVAVLLGGAWLHEVGLSERGGEDSYNIHSARAVWDPETGVTRVS